MGLIGMIFGGTERRAECSTTGIGNLPKRFAFGLGRLTVDLHLEVPPSRVPLPILRLARVSSRILRPLRLLYYQRSVRVHSLPPVDRQHLPLPLPRNGLYGVPRNRALDHQTGTRHSDDPGHLPDERQPVDVDAGAVRDLPHAVVRRARVLAAVLTLNVADVHVADHVVLDGHVLADQEARAVRDREAVQRPRELRRRVALNRNNDLVTGPRKTVIRFAEGVILYRNVSKAGDKISQRVQIQEIRELIFMQLKVTYLPLRTSAKLSAQVAMSAPRTNNLVQARRPPCPTRRWPASGPSCC